MSKEHGLGNALYVEGRDLSGETQTWGLSGSKSMQNATTLRQLAFDRLGLLSDGSFNYETLFDPAVGKSHTYLATLPVTPALVTVCHRETLGAPTWSMYCNQINYDPTEQQDKSLLFKVDGQGTKGTFWDPGVLVTPGMRTDVTATNGLSVDLGVAAHAFGLQAYLHVFAFVGTTCTIKLQGSSDNAVGDPFADITGGGFTAVTGGAPLSERITTARNLVLERYIRVITTGTFTSITFAVSVVVNDVNVVV
jgi:hypothetical protein